MEAQPWPIAGPLIGLRRPDLWYRNRARASATLPAGELAGLVARWGLTAPRRMLRVGSGRSRTWLVECREGPVLLKRYKPSLEDLGIASEHAVLRHLEACDAPVVRLRQTSDGESVVQHGSDRYAAFHALRGYVALHEILLTPAARRRSAAAAGSMLARLHDLLEDFRPPTAPSTGLNAEGGRARPSSWHVDRLETLGPGDEFMAAATRLRGLDASCRAMDLHSSVIHGDFGPYNLLVRRGYPVVIADFELARRDWRLVDVATALPRFAQGRLGFSRQRAVALLDGYRNVSHSIDAELRFAPTVLEFLKLRFAALCLQRRAATNDEGALAKARAALADARSLELGTHPLAQLIREAG